MPYIGGTEVPILTVADGDNTTAVTLTITRPDGSSTTATPATTDRITWTAPPILYNQADTWSLLWAVTGAGANVLPRSVFVQPLPPVGGPSWRPSPADVGKYVPSRTLVVDRATATNIIHATFDAATQPTGMQVESLITDAVGWVTLRVGTVVPALYPMASSAAALWAAAAVERGYPTRESDVNIAADLQRQADAMRADLALANEAATGVDPENPAATLVPIWQFPPPPRWADRDFN
jgi:hypothetical protein